MSQPAYPYLPAPLSTQDFTDDDPQVLDSLVQETNAPADLSGGIVPTTLPPAYKPKNSTKVFGTFVSLSGGAPPQRLLGEDVDRGTCKVKVYSSASPITFNDYVIVTDDLGNLAYEAGVISSRQSLAIVAHHGETLDFDGHTGQLWVIPGNGITATITVTAYGVTSIDGSPMNNV